MKKYSILVIAVFTITISCFSQTNFKYLNKYFVEVDKDSAIYKRELNNKSGVLNTYYITGELFETTKYKKHKLVGPTIQYYINGNIEEIKNYEDEKLIKIEKYYKNGQKKKDISVKEYKHTLTNFWDSTGRQLVYNGNGFLIDYYENGKIKEHGQLSNFEKVGIWVDYHENGNKYEKGVYRNNKKDSLWIGWNKEGKKDYEEKYSLGEFIQGTDYSDSIEPCIYYKLAEETYYPGNIGKYINEEVKKREDLLDYLLMKRSKKPLKINFIITIGKDGIVKNVEIMRSENSINSFDSYLIEIIFKSGQWIPAKLRCRNIMRKVMLPIRF